MGIVESGFTSSASGSEQITYGTDISSTWGFIGWSGTITGVTCTEYRDGSYYDSYTLISSKSCVDSRAEWGLYGATFNFNYGAAYCTTKFVMNISTTLGNSVFTYEYIMVNPTVTAPTNLQIVQNSDGTFTASWNASTGSNGSGSVYYRLWNYTDGEALGSRTTSTSATYNIPCYGEAIQFRVQATYNGASSSSDGSVSAYSSVVTATFTDTLPVIFNGTQLTKIIYNGTTISSLVYNGTKLF